MNAIDERPELSVLLRTDRLVVVDKPEGIASIPERFEHDRCINKILAAQLGVRPFVVHRLDKEVSGVLVFALTPECHRELSMLFESQQVHKTYTAVVHGVPPEDSGLIDSPIRQFGSGRMGVDTRRGKPCRTEFAVAERFPTCSILQVQPRTGRRHQIRVHLYSLGHPIVGDRRYGDITLQQQYPRLLLHASTIRFTLSGEGQLEVTSPLPRSYSAVVQLLQSQTTPPVEPAHDSAELPQK